MNWGTQCHAESFQYLLMLPPPAYDCEGRRPLGAGEGCGVCPVPSACVAQVVHDDSWLSMVVVACKGKGVLLEHGGPARPAQAACIRRTIAVP